MGTLNPTNLETYDYGTAGWSAIAKTNYQKLNTAFDKIWVTQTNTTDKALIRYNSSTGKWVVTSFTETDINNTISHISNTNNPHSVTKAQVGLGDIENIKSNFTASAAPTVNDDNTEGYSIGSVWLYNNKVYYCTDATTAAAVWENVNDNTELIAHINNTNNPHNVTKTQVGLGDVENIKSNLTASTAPTATNDNTEGYSIGSIWIDVSTDDCYICLDDTTNTAVWKKTTGTGSGTISFINLYDVPSSYAGQAGLFPRVKSDESGLEFAAGAGGDTLPVLDTVSLVKNSTDTTKQVRINANNLTTGTVRIINMPDKDITPMGELEDDTAPKLGGELNAQAHTIGFTLQSYTGTGTVNIDWTQGNYAKVTLTGNTTLTFTNPTNACTLNLHIFQDSNGGYTLTLPSGIVWVDNDAPALSTAANNKATIILQWDGTEYLASYVEYQ